MPKEGFRSKVFRWAFFDTKEVDTIGRKWAILVLCLAVWIAIGMMDYSRLHRFEKPIFCITTELADDGGSGRYVGLGYVFEIEGNFMPEDIFPGVTKWTAFLFGKEVETQIRD